MIMIEQKDEGFVSLAVRRAKIKHLQKLTHILDKQIWFGDGERGYR
jgi:hypothetical protein